MSISRKNTDLPSHFIVTDEDTSSGHLTRNNQSCENFAFRTLTLDAAVAPLLRSPVVPFETKKRKIASTAAHFYSECALQGIPPIAADKASMEVKHDHKKWWEDTKRKRQKTTNLEGDTNLEPRLRKELGENLMFQFTQPNVIQCAKQNLVKDLERNNGVISSSEGKNALMILEQYFSSAGEDCRWKTLEEECLVDGKWQALTKPEYSECKGCDAWGSYTYSLGRISFDMFRPNNLDCSVSRVFNTISSPPANDDRHERPRSLSAAMRTKAAKRKPLLKDFDITVELDIHCPSSASSGSIPARLINYGYCVPDPNYHNRLSIWFSGGYLEPRYPERSADLKKWMELFDTKSAPWRDTSSYAEVLATRILLRANLPDGISEQGRMSYSLNEPIGGHCEIFVDTVFCDKDLRIARGHQGSLFVFKRVFPEK